MSREVGCFQPFSVTALLLEDVSARVCWNSFVSMVWFGRLATSSSPGFASRGRCCEIVGGAFVTP